MGEDWVGAGGMRDCDGCGATFPVQDLYQVDGEDQCGTCVRDAIVHLETTVEDLKQDIMDAHAEINRMQRFDDHVSSPREFPLAERIRRYCSPRQRTYAPRPNRKPPV